MGELMLLVGPGITLILPVTLTNQKLLHRTIPLCCMMIWIRAATYVWPILSRVVVSLRLFFR